MKFIEALSQAAHAMAEEGVPGDIVVTTSAEVAARVELEHGTLHIHVGKRFVRIRSGAAELVAEVPPGAAIPFVQGEALQAQALEALAAEFAEEHPRNATTGRFEAEPQKQTYPSGKPRR